MFSNHLLLITSASQSHQGRAATATAPAVATSTSNLTVATVANATIDFSQATVSCDPLHLPMGRPGWWQCDYRMKLYMSPAIQIRLKCEVKLTLPIKN
jgi:hypothetical protein